MSRVGAVRSGPLGVRSFRLLAGGQFTLGNVTVVTVLQRWTPPALLGRVMSAVMLCAFGSFPLSVAVAGLLVRHVGPALFFPVAGAVLAVATLGGLTQREFREFGAREAVPAAGTTDRSAKMKKAAT